MKSNFFYSLLFLIIFHISCTSPESEFRQAKKYNNVEGYRKFISNYPESQLKDSAQYLLWKRAYEIAQDTNTVSSLTHYISSYPESHLLNTAKEKLCALIFLDSSILDTSKLRKYYSAYSEYPSADSIAWKTWKIIRSENLWIYPWYFRNFPGTSYAKNAEDYMAGIEYRILDSVTILITKGFDYQKDYKMNEPSRMHILREQDGLFETTGLTVIPYCNLADESKEENQDDSGFFTFTPLTSAVNMYWTFAPSVMGVSICMGKHYYKFIPRSAHSKISFKNNGVLVHDMNIVPVEFYNQ